jgi:hypothetical protein
MKWFGESWDAPVCEIVDHVATPVGEKCLHCDEPIAEGDYGVVIPLVDGNATIPIPEHYACFMRRIIGSIAHLTRRCSCYVPGADEGDPPGLSKRLAAELALEHYERIGRANARNRHSST